MVTALTASILGLLYARISLFVVSARRKNQIAYGYGENGEIMGPVSAHSNFASYIPILLILLYFTEMNGHLPLIIILAIATLIVVGRFLHFKGLSGDKTNFKFRRWGMYLTILPMIFMSVLNLVTFIYDTLIKSPH